MLLHHVSLRTADIFAAIAFYEALGFQVSDRFQIDTVLACWLEGCGTRLELIQVPEPEPAAGYFANEHFVGYQHLSFVVASVSEILRHLGTVSLLLAPHTQQIGAHRYEVAFIASPDGLPVELLAIINE